MTKLLIPALGALLVLSGCNVNPNHSSIRIYKDHRHTHHDTRVVHAHKYRPGHRPVVRHRDDRPSSHGNHDERRDHGRDDRHRNDEHGSHNRYNEQHPNDSHSRNRHPTGRNTQSHRGSGTQHATSQKRQSKKPVVVKKRVVVVKKPGKVKKARVIQVESRRPADGSQQITRVERVTTKARRDGKPQSKKVVRRAKKRLADGEEVVVEGRGRRVVVVSRPEAEAEPERGGRHHRN